MQRVCTFLTIDTAFHWIKIPRFLVHPAKNWLWALAVCINLFSDLFIKLIFFSLIQIVPVNDTSSPGVTYKCVRAFACREGETLIDQYYCNGILDAVLQIHREEEVVWIDSRMRRRWRRMNMEEGEWTCLSCLEILHTFEHYNHYILLLTLPPDPGTGNGPPVTIATPDRSGVHKCTLWAKNDKNWNCDLNESCGSNFHSGRNSIFCHFFGEQRTFMHTRSVGVTVAKSAKFVTPAPTVGVLIYTAIQDL